MAHRARVLIVDDEKVFCDTMSKVLRHRNMKVASANGGAEGLEWLKGHRCDVVVLDLKMPEMDGIETLRRIRDKNPRVGIIILTGHGNTEAGLEAIRQTAFDFLLKPVDIDHLVQVIQQAVELDLGAMTR